MNFEFTENGWEDFQYWIDTDSSIVEKIKDLLNEFFTFWCTGTNDAERVIAVVTHERLDEAGCLGSASSPLGCSDAV